MTRALLRLAAIAATRTSSSVAWTITVSSVSRSWSLTSMA